MNDMRTYWCLEHGMTDPRPFIGEDLGRVVKYIRPAADDFEWAPARRLWHTRLDLGGWWFGDSVVDTTPESVVADRIQDLRADTEEALESYRVFRDQLTHWTGHRLAPRT